MCDRKRQKNTPVISPPLSPPPPRRNPREVRKEEEMSNFLRQPSQPTPFSPHASRKGGLFMPRRRLSGWRGGWAEVIFYSIPPLLFFFFTSLSATKSVAAAGEKFLFRGKLPFYTGEKEAERNGSGIVCRERRRRRTRKWCMGYSIH